MMRNKGYELKLGDNERLDDLECGELLLVQRTDKYCFNSDSVLIANLIDNPRNKVIADLGAGSGVISILLAGKRGAKRVYAVELQEFMLELLDKNVVLNDLSDVIEIVPGKMQDAYETIGKNVCDVVVSNPPYSKVCEGLASKDEQIALCRHEIAVTLDEVIASAATLLKPKGAAYFIYKTARLGEVFNAVHAKGMAVKKLYMISPTPSAPVDTVIVKAVKGAAEGLVLEQITVFDENREMSESVAKLYGKIK